MHRLLSPGRGDLTNQWASLPVPFPQTGEKEEFYCRLLRDSLVRVVLEIYRQMMGGQGIPQEDRDHLGSEAPVS